MQSSKSLKYPMFLYLDGYIMVGDKKFLLYADGSTARLRLVT